MKTLTKDVSAFFGFLVASFIIFIIAMNRLSSPSGMRQGDFKAIIIISLVVALVIAILTAITPKSYKRNVYILTVCFLFVLLIAPANLVRIIGIVLVIALPLGFLYTFMIYLPGKAGDTIQEPIVRRKILKNMEETKAAHGVVGWAEFRNISYILPPVITGLNVTGSLDTIGCGEGERRLFGFKWNAKGHIITIGSARGGKGSCLILNALLDRCLAHMKSPSFIVLDPKGENLAVAGRYLQSVGYKLIVINPFNIKEISDFENTLFNPLMGVFDVNDEDCDKYIDIICFSLIPPSQSNNPFFDNAARNILGVYIRHLLTQDQEPKTFRTLYRWLRYAGEDREKLLMSMALNFAFEGVIQDNAMSIQGQLSEGGGREIEAVYSTVRTHTDIFGNPQLRKSLEDTEFDISSISKEKTALFICMKPEELKNYQGYIRLFFNMLLRKLTENYNNQRKVVMILDEFASAMGHDKTIDESMAFIAGYNITIWLVVHDLTQLRGLYPKNWETFVNNASIRHWLSIGDNFTADYLSRRMPTDINFTGVNQDLSLQHEKKPLLTPNEILNFKEIIIEIEGVGKMARFHKVPYWELTNEYSQNPFFRR